MTGKRKTVGVLPYAIYTALTPVDALARSPEFVYTAKGWTQLRDNGLEFDKIDDLIHKYNNTVI